ncbi:hypothetical protein L6164_037095 [Bauhinia variegata]|uniref:Uncharacterized protein n=1 Tax=Bauhinia variegata TaxID=167791 RepID=A0ACB9KJ04_BAUVA|nr:hypothetical protein L6164_037095 [Bauhinia variegata]
MLHPSRVKSFSGARKRVLGILVDKLKSDSESSSSGIRVAHHFQYAMFCLLVCMCFGDTADEKQIREIEEFQRRLIVDGRRFAILNFWPSITKILFNKRWKEFLQLIRDREAALIPLITGRRKAKQERSSKAKEESTVPYIDTLLDLQISEENTHRNLHERELVSLCSEFLTGGTDTTSTALQWIMANLVKYPRIQDRVVGEIRDAMGDKQEREVKEEDLQKLPYLKAVILEGLRLHPPGHFVLPHVVTNDVVLEGYSVPKSSTINFMVAEMGRDPRVWEDPMAFKPERFLNSEGSELEAFDITGRKEIKMMPFGAGRRICPGYNLALLHLEYFLANLIWNFEWKVENGVHVDLSEKQEFTVVMKTPLQAQIAPRLQIS